MKKILFFVCVMLYAVGVKALEPTLHYQENIYSNRVGAENKIWSGQMAFIFMEGEIVYCLDPYLIVGHNYTINNNYSINADDLEYYSLVAYYGYNATDRNDIYYYMAAQELIWEHMIGSGNAFWTTGQYNTGFQININKYKKEIKENIANYYKKPNLFGEYRVASFDSLNLHDSNNVLHSYSMVKNGNSNIKKSGDDISITMYDKDQASIKLERKISNNLNTKIYQTDNGQALISLGVDKVQTMDVKIKLDYFKTNAYINFYNQLNEKVDDISFSICDLDKEIIKTDKGYLIENIREGKYQICDLENPYQDVFFEINKDNFAEETYVDIYLKDSVEPKREIKVVKKEEKITEETKIKEDGEFPDVLPNTYDYESPVYVLILFILIGCGIYEIK